MKKLILVRIGEIALKGLNRTNFEHMLAKNMKEAVKAYGACRIGWSQSRFYVEPETEEFDFDGAVEALCRVFGIVSVSPAYVVESDFDAIKDEAIRLCGVKLSNREYERMQSVKFKVETKRVLKTFPMSSHEVSAEIGGMLLDTYEKLTVDVNNPDFIVYAEIREKTYVYVDIIKGQGGMPVGCNGRGMLLLSGGIDSPVAGYMIAKRGVRMYAVHFHSYPYTSERAKEKVIELARICSKYCNDIKLFIVPYTETQLAIHENCREELGTVIMRRSMMRIAEHFARECGCQALVTGESIGQVASQTMQAMYCTNDAANMPVFRPLIGMDKVEVVEIANRIGTFETSIQPYEDCCTVFTAKHPKTKPTLAEVLAEEEKYDYKELEKKAIEGVEVIWAK